MACFSQELEQSLGKHKIVKHETKVPVVVQLSVIA